MQDLRERVSSHLLQQSNGGGRHLLGNNNNNNNAEDNGKEEVMGPRTKRQAAPHRPPSNSTHDVLRRFLILWLNALQDLKFRFRFLSPPWRAAVVAVFGLLSVGLFTYAYDYAFSYYGPARRGAFPSVVTDSRSSSSHDTSSFAVVINTYKRPRMLADAVRHYAETCGKRSSIDQVFVIWAELQVSAPTSDSFFAQRRQGGLKGTSSTADGADRPPKYRSEVEVVLVDKDSLHSRFYPLANLRTHSVFMVDDDIRVDCQSLNRGFLAWKTYPNSMVGFYPRLGAGPHVSFIDNNKPENNDNAGGGSAAAVAKYVYYSWPTVFWHHRMNFVLTKAAFIHRRYMALYTSDDHHPREIKDYVDKYMNCEDVAMSMLIANVTRAEESTKAGSGNAASAAPPIYLQGSVSDKGLFNGISTGSGHMVHRSECLTELTRIYEDRGWGAPLREAWRLDEVSWYHRAPGFWWQHRPSNIFEWFALGNIWK